MVRRGQARSQVRTSNQHTTRQSLEVDGGQAQHPASTARRKSTRAQQRKAPGKLSPSNTWLSI